MVHLQASMRKDPLAWQSFHVPETAYSFSPEEMTPPPQLLKAAFGCSGVIWRCIHIYWCLFRMLHDTAAPGRWMLWGKFVRKGGALITVVEMAKYLRRKEKKVIWLWLVYGSADLGVSLCAFMQYGCVTMPYTALLMGCPEMRKSWA